MSEGTSGWNDHGVVSRASALRSLLGPGTHASSAPDSLLARALYQGECLGQLHRVVAGVEDEQWEPAIVGPPLWGRQVPAAAMQA